MIVVFLIFHVSLVSAQLNFSEKDLTVFDAPVDTMMKAYFTKIIDKQFLFRDSLLSNLRTVEDWNGRKEIIRDSMISWTGPLPERTPLNARITGRLYRNGYIIEKILFESRPKYFVSANLYLPTNVTLPCPAQLNLVGHSQLGKADERYQRMSIAQVRNGFVVMTIDQLGQGERGLLSLHRIAGIQSFTCGTHVFNFMLWDAIRAIDYLTSRTEVDTDRVSVTGSSGGGMMTTYMLPFEDRISVAVPTCNPNTWNHRVHENLGTDHEQVFFGAFESGIDPRGDPLFCHVPKPLMLNTTTDDNLNPVRGVWDLNTWLFKSYSAFNMPENLATTMVKAGHDYNQEQRELTYSWIGRWAGIKRINHFEKDILIEKEEDLWATNEGNVLKEADSRSIHDLVLDFYDKNKANWNEIASSDALLSHKVEMRHLIKRLLNSNFNIEYPAYELKKKKKVGNVWIQHFVVETESGILLPGFFLDSENESSNSNLVLYLSDYGKSSILEDYGIVEDFLQRGNRICAVDLRGIGETSPDLANKFWDFLAGKPIFGQRVKDVLSIVKWLKESEIKSDQVKYWGKGMCSLYGVFAGVLSDAFSGYILEEPLISFESLVLTSIPGYDNEILLPGILKYFDMEQVFQAICPKPILVLNPLSGEKMSANFTERERLNNKVNVTYGKIDKDQSFVIKVQSQTEKIVTIIRFLTS